LAIKLTDDDIGAILACINARQVLTTLKLTGCVNITGNGLEPLRGSVVLEQIDLSLVKQHEGPYMKPEPLMSETPVLSILNSIVDEDENSLKQVQLPFKFRQRRESSIPDQFLSRYNQQVLELMENLRFRCSKCGSLNCDTSQSWRTWDQSHHYGLLETICYKCTNSFCTRCEEGGDVRNIGGCWICEKVYCADCVPTAKCEICGVLTCSGCGSMTDCDDCGRDACEVCIHTCECCNTTRCDECVTYVQCECCDSKAHCADCYDGKDHDVGFCEDCYNTFCGDCRLSKQRKDWNAACTGCMIIIAPSVVPMLLENEKEHENIRTENERLRQENESLRLENKRLAQRK